MDASAFDADLARALGVCRAAADLRLPIEEMIEDVSAAIERADEKGLGGATGYAELEALREILAAVGDVAAIGAKLPPSDSPPESFPMPANLRG